MSFIEQDTIHALRQFIRAGQPEAVKKLPDLLGRVGAWSTPGPGAPSAAATEGVFLLWSALRGQRDMALASRLLQNLCCAGRLGRAYAALHIQGRAVPLPQLTPLVTGLPGRDFLALLNDMLADSPADDKPLQAWLRGLLPTPGKLDAREALLFLKTQAEEQAPLARPLREALLAAGMAEGMAQAFAGTPGAATAEALMGAVSALAAPAVEDEALAYSLRAAGSDGPSRLGPLLAAPPDQPGRDDALATEMHRLALDADACRLLQHAARTEPEMLGLVLATLLKKGGAQQAAGLRLLPMLPRLGVRAVLADVPDKAHGVVYGRLMQALAVQDADFLRRAARALGPGHGLGEAEFAALAELLAAPPLLSLAQAAPWPAPPAAPGLPAPQAAQQAAALAALLAALSGPPLPLKEQDFSHARLDGASIEGLAVSASRMAGCRMAKTTLRRVRLSSSLAAQCVFTSCAFNACTFVGMDMQGAQFHACTFDACAFDACDLSAAQFHGCTLRNSAFTESSLAGALLVKSRADSVSLRTCAIGGAQMVECAFNRLLVIRSDLSGTRWEKCVNRESEAVACTLAWQGIHGCEFTGITLSRCGAPGLSVLGGHTDSPRLSLAEQSTRSLCTDNACRETVPLPPALQKGAGAAFARDCVERWLRVDEARRTLAAMRGQDHRRRELALERLTEPQGELLKLLPALLATDVFDKANNLSDTPACALAGAHKAPGLGREAVDLLERYFPGIAPTPAAQKPPEMLLEAVYAIGSLGSVAQKPSSDVDCWVCFTPLEGAGPEVRAGLARKLTLLEQWAWREFALETHFFVMDMNEVRQNRFGISDKESSGSAQAALLKEEFYRTALKLGGRDLLWWAAPPASTQDEALALFRELKALAPRTAAELVDLGQPSPIPPGEFFGACLWQIVKALHSPYKSVMKLGLLERYAGQGQDARLLCDRIKEAVLRGRKRAENVDPYLSLFTSIRKHYRGLDDAGSLALMGECLRLKAQVDPLDLPAEFAPATGERPEAAELSAFAAALRLGGMVNLFMVSAYRRIQEGIRTDKKAARISPEDLTKLGRRIAANFAQHKHKVGLVPFLSEDLGITELGFYAEKAPGRRTIWGVKGKDKTAGKAPVESLPPLRRDTDVVRLLAWLLFNGMYDPKIAIQAEKSFAPVAVMDLQNLLADLAAFFPRRATLEPDLDEYLKPERVVRAYLILNLPVAQDKSKLISATALYATNWGEVFCETFDNPPPGLLKTPLGFLRESLAKPIPGEIELKAFTPKRSACPKLKL